MYKFLTFCIEDSTKSIVAAIDPGEPNIVKMYDLQTGYHFSSIPNIAEHHSGMKQVHLVENFNICTVGKTDILVQSLA